MTIYGTPNNEIHDDSGSEKAKVVILSRFPDAVKLDRLPLPYESYIHGTGYVLDSEQQKIDIWTTEIAETDVALPRCLENLYDNNPSLVRDTWTEEKYKTKKEIRGRKPLRKET